MEKQQKLFISLYNDYYGALLTPYQSQLITRYYDQDMSLSEIATELGISPQGVRDALQRAEKSLINLEEKLKLVEKTNKMRQLLQEFYSVADEKQKKQIQQALDMLDD